VSHQGQRKSVRITSVVTATEYQDEKLQLLCIQTCLHLQEAVDFTWQLLQQLIPSNKPFINLSVGKRSIQKFKESNSPDAFIGL